MVEKALRAQQERKRKEELSVAVASPMFENKPVCT